MHRHFIDSYIKLNFQVFNNRKLFFFSLHDSITSSGGQTCKVPHSQPLIAQRSELLKLQRHSSSTNTHASEDYRDFSRPLAEVLRTDLCYFFSPWLHSYFSWPTFWTETELSDYGCNGKLNQDRCLWMGILLWLYWSRYCGWEQTEIQQM